MDETLLFFHVLSAFFLVAGIVIFSSFVLGGPVNRPSRLIAEILWGVGGVGTIVFGVWLALNRPEYEIWDGWIIAALVLWVLANGAGAQVSRAIKPARRRLAVGDRPPGRDSRTGCGSSGSSPCSSSWSGSRAHEHDRPRCRPHDWNDPPVRAHLRRDAVRRRADAGGGLADRRLAERLGRADPPRLHEPLLRSRCRATS